MLIRTVGQCTCILIHFLTECDLYIQQSPIEANDSELDPVLEVAIHLSRENGGPHPEKEPQCVCT